MRKRTLGLLMSFLLPLGLVDGCFLLGCNTTLTGRGELGVGSRTDYYFYHEAKRSTDTATFDVSFDTLVEHFIDLGMTEEDAKTTAEKLNEAGIGLPDDSNDIE